MKVKKVLKETNYIKIIAGIIVGLAVFQVLNNSHAIDNSTEDILVDWKQVHEDFKNEISTAVDDQELVQDEILYSIDSELKELTNVIKQIPNETNSTVITVNNNIPLFTEDEIKYAEEIGSYESYSELDNLGRCGPAMAYIGKELMPTEERGSISEIKPTGWHLYNTKNEWNIVLPSGNFYLLQRAHLIAYCLTSENANPRNLITGTDQLNQAMVDYEVKVARYVEDNDINVLYRVTPVFENNNLLAKGVLIEAQTLENNDICFCVFVYNIQNNFAFNYANGEATYKGE